jgi:hypothetical protein
MMTHDFEHDEDLDVRAALQHELRHRFDGVDWERLHDRIVGDALTQWDGPRGPAQVLAAWSRGGAIAASALLAAALAALLLVPPDAGGDAAEAGFWPVAEELLAGVPDETRRLIDAGTRPDRLLELVVADAREEVTRR